MSNYLSRAYTAVFLAVVASFSMAFAQVPANLGAPAGIGGLGVTNMSVDLSAHNGPSDLSVAGGGSRARGPAGSSLTFRPNSLTSRSSVIDKYVEAPQETSTPSLRAGRKPTSLGFAATGARVSPIRSFGFSDTVSLGALAPPSFDGRSSIPPTPLYSFLVRHGKPDSRFGASQHSLSRKPNRRKNSQGSLIQSLTGVASGGFDR
jgi:hypothetical protein